MEEWWTNFHFLRPWWLLLLLPLIFYGRYLRGADTQSSWEKVCDKRLLEFLLIKGSSSHRKIIAWLGAVGLFSAIIAAAGPSWTKIEIPSLAPENPTMILLNLSSDMQEKDLSPSRLDRAKYKIKDLLALLKGTQTGLEVYSNEPFLISPLTEDSQIITNLLPAVSYNIMPANGDRLDRAIDLAVEKFKNAQFQQGEIIVFAPDAGQRFDLALEAAKRAASQNYKVNIIAISASPVEKLKMIAENGGGNYWTLQSNDEEIQSLAKKITANKSEMKESKNWQSVWLDYGYYLLIIPLLCCLSFFRKGILVIALLLCAKPADAGFFLNSNQEGLKAFNQQDFQRASQEFKDYQWKGAALYRMGEYDNAYNEFSKGEGVDALYNQGNALAKGGKIEEAIKKYEEVLQIAPHHEDAKFNLEYLKRQQQQQQNQNQKNQDQNQQNQDNDSQSNQGDGDNQNEQNKGDSKDSEQQNKESESSNNPSQSEDNAESQKSEEGKEQNSSQNNETQNSEQNQSENLGQPSQNSQNSNSGQQEPQESEAGETQVGAEPKESQDQESPQQEGAGAAAGNEDEKYDEEIQARAQQYREIPEDPGGLLKAFIYKEYHRNRYNEK